MCSCSCVLYISLLVLFFCPWPSSSPDWPCLQHPLSIGNRTSLHLLSLSLGFSLSFSPSTLSSILSLFRLSLFTSLYYTKFIDDFTKSSRSMAPFSTSPLKSRPNCSMVRRFSQLWTDQIQRKGKWKDRQRRATLNSLANWHCASMISRNFVFSTRSLEIMHNVNYLTQSTPGNVDFFFFGRV